jgi:uncharacterized repeat protein (TIGR04138 family)
MPSSPEDRLKKVVAQDGRYPLPAYRFVYEALEYTVRRLPERRHVSGRELLEGIRDLALGQFGALAIMVFDHWNIRKTGDFGEIVFNLVNADLMSRSEQDCREEFENVYDFRAEFRIDAAPPPPREGECR